MNSIWLNVLKNENEVFKTAREIPYTYTVKNDAILINNDKRRKITRNAIERALKISAPTPSKIEKEGIWGHSYVYGIITDSRIVK